MSKILVSSCLLGEKVRYDGKILQYDSRLNQLHKVGIVLSFCPEIAGGLDVPRIPAEIQDSSGESVLDGVSRIVRRDGVDVTDAFVLGANKALETVKSYGIAIAILKSKSPSCGSVTIYDGTFSGRLREGQGVTAALLQKNGVKIFQESQIDEALYTYISLGFELPDNFVFDFSK